MKTKLIIFGITGDLSQRKLLPALSHLLPANPDMTVVGVSRREVNTAELLNSSIGSDALVDRFSIVSIDLADPAGYQKLKQTVDIQAGEQALVYLSVPPSAAADIVDFLGQAGFNGPEVKILFEKPFGFDLASAHEYIDRTHRYYHESALYRIDHYMAKDVAMEVVGLHAQTADGPGWGSETIERVDIVASETIGVEDRATFYEQTGALRDFLQGHLMQLLALILLDSSTTETLPEQRLAALKAIAVAQPHDAVRGQYAGYQAEVHNIGSRTETFACLELTSDDPRWQGVDLNIATGKALSEKRSAITILQKDGTEHIFEEGVAQQVAFEETHTPDAYERVLTAAIEGDRSIFTTSDEVLEAWRIVAAVQQQWSLDDAPLIVYQPGADVESVRD